jgi:hypothetical protein
MNWNDGKLIAGQLREWLKDACELGGIVATVETNIPLCVIAGSVRRMSQDVHDIELVSKPILKAPRPEFGGPLYKTEFDKVLARLEEQGYIHFLMGGEKLKKYEVHLLAFGLVQTLNPFKVEFYQCTPPAQFGVLLAIRTGPAKDDNNFSKWIVTQRKNGGALPNGYRVKHAAVWREDQIDAKDEPIKGESPISMPDEMDFFNFLEVKWIQPANRRAMWRTVKNG